MTNANPRVVVIGGGAWGRNLVRNFAELGALEAIVDANPEMARELALQHRCRALIQDEALSDAGIAAVVIAAPAALHYRMASAALDAGKHVFVEKPLSLEVAEATELCKLA